jgi:hypothetical protein
VPLGIEGVDEHLADVPGPGPGGDGPEQGRGFGDGHAVDHMIPIADEFDGLFRGRQLLSILFRILIHRDTSSRCVALSISSLILDSCETLKGFFSCLLIA